MIRKFSIFSGLILLGAIGFYLNQTSDRNSPPVPNESADAKTITEYTCIGGGNKRVDGIELDSPVSIVWDAKLIECIGSCHGALFVKKSIASGVGSEFPNFIGYYKDGVIPEKFKKNELELKISGNWEMIYTDDRSIILNNQCVPIIEISKIETL